MLIRNLEFSPPNLLFSSKYSLRTYNTKSPAIYLEEDGISILNRELTLLTVYYSCNVFILFKRKLSNKELTK